MIKKNIYLIVKAYPEESKKYGSSICMAGLTDTNEWIRMYPVDLFYVSLHNEEFKKWIYIKAELDKSNERLMRKESYKVKQESVGIIDDILTKTKKKGIWERRNSIILKTISNSVEELQKKNEYDKTSIGIIKPREYEFIFRKEFSEISIQRRGIQKTLDGRRLSIPDKIDHEFAYKFKCNNPNCQGHNMICEDWELFESFRTWRYPPDLKKEKMIQKFDIEMKQRDLYFILGTTNPFGTWVIIGLYYPPKDSNKK